MRLFNPWVNLLGQPYVVIATRTKSEELMSPDQKQMMALIGVTLLRIQATETVVQFCMTYVLQPNLTWEMLNNRQQRLRTKTLVSRLGNI
jgi:hypothetical protein